MDHEQVDFCDLVEERLLARQIEFLKTRSPDDWHRFAGGVNWDGTLKGLYWVVAQPECDRATAALIFWMGEPTGYDFEDCTETMGDNDYAVAPMLRFICERFNTTGYPRAEIAFNYAEARGLPPDYDRAESESGTLIEDALEIADRQVGHDNPLIKIHPDLMKCHLPGRRVRTHTGSDGYWDLVPTYEQLEQELIAKLDLGDQDPYLLPPLERSSLPPDL